MLVKKTCKCTLSLTEDALSALDRLRASAPYVPSRSAIVEDLIRAAGGLENYSVAVGMVAGARP